MIHSQYHHFDGAILIYGERGSETAGKPLSLAAIQGYVVVEKLFF